MHSADSCAGSTATHSLNPTTCEGNTRTDRSSLALAARTRTASASTRTSARRTRARTRPPVSAQIRGSTIALHPGARLGVASAVSATTIEARHASSSPAPIAANTPGNRDTNPAAVRTRSSAPRDVNPSIGATLTAANSPTNPAPRSTATHDPSPARTSSRAAIPANPTACTADAAFTTRCAASTTPASSPRSGPSRPAATPADGVLRTPRCTSSQRPLE